MIRERKAGLMSAVLGLALASVIGCEASPLAPGGVETGAERAVDDRVEKLQQAEEERERREALADGGEVILR